ncbi:XRE family transcriptional regulator [Nonomuraea monospora]
MHRRAAMQLFAALGAGAAIPPGVLEDVLSGVERSLDVRVNLDEWESAVDEYAHLHVRRPVGDLIRDLTSDVIAVGRLLDRGCPPSAQAGLLRVSAGLSGLLGTELSDFGDLRASRVAWRTARRAADASGDRDVAVWVRAKEASDGVWGGRPVPVIAGLADEAIAMAQGAPSYGLFRAHTVRARLAAQQGDHATARSALHDFTWTLENLPQGTRSADAAFGLVRSGLGGGFLNWHQADIRTTIGDGAAERTVDSALAAYPAEIPGPRVLLQLMHAVRLVRERDVLEGVGHALSAIQTGHVSSAQRHFVKQLLNALPEQAHGMDTAKELRALAGAG